MVISVPCCDKNNCKMASTTLIITIFATYICFVNAHPECTTPYGAGGVCKSLYECSYIEDVIKKPNKSPEDTNFLEKSKCGLDGSTLKVCCPNPCYTPEGKEGKCIAITSCAPLANLLQPPVTQENKQYVIKSKCIGREPLSVCCGPQRDTSVVLPSSAEQCAASVSAFPPDPASHCCGLHGSNADKIIGGEVTAVDQYPWLVIIEYVQGRLIKLLCGGALISGKYVLTAGHCVTGEILQYGTPTSVRLSEFDTRTTGRDCAPAAGGGEDCTEGEVTIPIERAIPHPNYNGYRKNGPNDIALLRLKQLAPFTAFIRPICLPSLDLTLNPPAPDNFTLFVAGWGKWEEEQPSSPLKLHVDLPFVKTDVCEPAYSSIGRNLKQSPGQICAGGVTGKDSCKGDSGGPLMYKNGKIWEAIGLVSFGPSPCAQANVPGVYTKVFEYIPWIRSVIVP